MIYKILPHTFVVIGNQTLIGKGIKLNQGSFIEGKILKILENNKLLIKIQNREIIAESLLKFKEGEEVNFWVKKVEPQIVLQTIRRNTNKLDKFVNFLIKELGENVKNLVFNPLTKNIENEFKKIIKEKKFIATIIKQIQNPETKKEFVEVINLWDEREYLFPVYVENKIYIIRFKSEKGEKNKETTTVYLSIETENIGTIEVEINKINQKLIINIFAENNKIVEYINLYIPLLKKIVDKYYKINFIAVRKKEKELFHKEIEITV